MFSVLMSQCRWRVSSVVISFTAVRPSLTLRGVIVTSRLFGSGWKQKSRSAPPRVTE